MPNFSGIWSPAQQFQARGQNLWPAAPGAPTIGTATAGTSNCASVTFTAPAYTGYPAGVSSYTAISTPGCITASGASSPLVVAGLTTGTSYTFRVQATGASGTGPLSAASNSITAISAGSDSYTAAGTYTWVAPANVTSVSVVAVGPGSTPCGNSTSGGAGGGLGYKNNIAVTPGNSYTVVVGTVGSSDSYFINTSTVRGGRGSIGSPGGTFTGDGGGNGGTSAANRGGGGAGGYSGNGGLGGNSSGSDPTTAGAGGAGGGGRGSGVTCRGGGGGGGVGLFGQGSNGAAAASATLGGGGGSGGANGQAGSTVSCEAKGGNGGAYGGGGGPSSNSNPIRKGTGGSGAVRIVWPGNTRQFPSTDVGAP